MNQKHSPSGFKALLLLAVMATALPQTTRAQDIPDVPDNVMFGGINVKFDNRAKRAIESDIRSLMSNKQFWDAKMDRAILYFPILEGVLIEEEVPLDFKYLAVQESSLRPDAVSTSDAVGFWQFKKETAQELGLLVNNQVDERKNITSSTRAAARYLKRSNEQYNNWVSALYSYYLGVGGVKELIPRNWAYAKEITLDGKTDQYVLRFFAHKIALEAGMERYRTANAIVLLEYRNGRGRTFSSIARELSLDPLELRRYNLWLDSDQIPADRDYVVALPVASDQINNVRELLLIAREDPAANFAKDDIGFPTLREASVQLKGRNDPVFYEINSLPGVQARPGDKASDLAKAAKIRTSSFLKYNDLSSRDPLVPGDVYYLAKKNKKGMVPFHTVREGETIRNISQIYGVRVGRLLKYNRISNRNQRLQTGRVMWLMKRRPANKPVEIINLPPSERSRTSPSITAPADQSYSQPELIGSAEDIPKNASERRRYKPKLADKTTEPVETPEVDEETPRDQTVYTKPNTPAPTQSTRTPARTSPNNNDRIVIIEQQGTEVKTPTLGSEPARTGTVRPAKSGNNTSTSTPASLPSSTGNRPTTSGSANPKYHSVEPGQTYYSISKLYNVEINDMLAWNQLTINDKLAVGQKLVVNPTAATTQNTSPSTGDFITHKVVSGETLFRISKNYGVSMQEIQTLNNMPDTNVKLGETLKIPKR
ncbi:LysM peptidoglycan-binding domain-containing protein [Persicitalea sp.]|uniref:LysM peptidoglycan-binding domain-containing protein n=1 Tax=Persicitalea sp. TaxID=3100273 RepID=UPI0035938EFC